MEVPPSKAELRLCRRLGLDATSSHDLVAAMRAGASSRPAVVLSPLAPPGYVPPFACVDTQTWGWIPPRVYVPQPGVRPAAYADYDEGLYYVLDLSSCWESAALSMVPPPDSCLDLCAAPGGKSMLCAARYRGMAVADNHAVHHVANEVNTLRRGILRQNLRQCGMAEVEVGGLRPDQWAASGRHFALLLVDAPCSGQSLLCKGIRNPGCLGASMVNGNAKRQKGIMLAAVQCVEPGGHILYTTCTYDPDENEKVAAYILRRVPGWSSVEVPVLSAFRSSLSSFPAYRLLPAHGYGAGGFCCLLRRDG